METFFQSITAFFWALAFLFFFGPMVIIIAIIGKVNLGSIIVDLSNLSKTARIVLAVLGGIVWVTVYFPVISLAHQALSQSDPSATPSLTSMSTATQQIDEQVTKTVLPTYTPSPVVGTETLPTATTDMTPDPTFIVITEVLGNPCGADSRNEFVELYNSGERAIDVGGWWITDGEEADRIVAWQDRYPTISLSSLVLVDTTLIPPRSFGVILAPGYPFVQSGRVMPYIFPEGTVILTVDKGQLLGDENNGIEVSNRDVIVLYEGSETSIDRVISTYGSPILSNSPLLVRDDGKDRIPYSLSDAKSDCWSVERILPVNEDIESNWKVSLRSSPGSGSYP